MHGHDEGHELLDTRVDGAALLNRLDDGAEVVIGEDHIGGTLGDLGTFETHGDTDVGAVERGSVVDAVAGHRADETLALQRLHNLKLILRLGAGKDGGGLGESVNLGVGEVLTLLVGAESSTVGGLAVALGEGVAVEDVDVLGDGNGRLEVVTGDHHDADASLAGLKDGILHAVTLGIDGRAKTAEGEAVDDLAKLGIGLLLLAVGELGTEILGSDGEHAERLGGQLVNLGGELSLGSLVEVDDGSVGGHVRRALLHDVVGGALHVRGVLTRLGDVAEGGFAGRLGDGDHHLAGGGEGNLVHAGEARLEVLELDAALVARDDEGSLGGVTAGGPLGEARVGVGLELEGGVGAENGGAEGGAHAAGVVRGLIALGGGDLAHGGVETLAGDGVVNLARVHGDEGHLTLGEGAGLVGADDGGGPEGLDRRDLAHQHVLLDHVGAAG